jgi:hypothetical protein
VLVALRGQLVATAAVVIILVATTFALTGRFGPIGQPGLLTTPSAPASTASGTQSTRPSSITYSGVFNPTGSMLRARFGQTATILADGRVLVIGGQSGAAGARGAIPPNASAEIYDPRTGRFTPTGSMTTGRSAHTATLLADGTVLVAGGSGALASALRTAELYNPRTGTFSPTGSMSTARSGETATLLPDGRALIAGGLGLVQNYSATALASAELYDPATGIFSQTGSMTTGRVEPTATLLGDGHVLIAGGDGSKGPLESAELYDPRSGSFSPTGSMTTPRSFQTATRLADGQVLIAGGHDANASLASAELYDPRIGTFASTGSMTTARYGQAATLLADGRLLIAGGFRITYVLGTNGPGTTLESAELYDPGTSTFSSTGSMVTARDGQTATLLADGSVLIVGGAEMDATGTTAIASAELFR